jgi:signal transduction histidine kinase/DNA-binding response OmpR family regulator
MRVLNFLLDIQSADLEEARRRKLLNVLLVGLALLTLLALMAGLVRLPSHPEEWPEYRELFQGGLVMLAGITVIYLINRYRPGIFAASLFLILLTLVLAFSDSPAEVLAGRTLFMFVIPILMASVLLRSYASFIAAAGISAIHLVIALSANLSLNAITLLAFFSVALVSWLASRSLERALEDFRAINRDLDKRVVERTQDLEEALAREHAGASKNQAILAGIADGVIVFDTGGTAVVVNPSIGRLLDTAVSEILGRNIQEIMGSAVSADNRELLSFMLESSGSRRPSIKVPWGNKTLSISFAPVRAAGETVTGTVTVFRDFTREAELDRMKSDFVSIASHELRTPLTSIKGYLELLLAGAAGEVNHKQEEFIQRARNNTERLYELVNDLLDLSRIESGSIELDVKLISLATVIQEAAQSLQPEFDRRGLKLSLEIAPDLPDVLADSRRITQVMFNLLSNAYKYTPQGTVTVRAQPLDHAVQVAIIDTGVGISASDQEKLFTRFFRSGDALVRQQSGTGLGLNITRSLIEMHGGATEVESVLGLGTVFRFTLPLPATQLGAGTTNGSDGYRQTAVPVQLRKTTPATAANVKILVVDDDVDVSRMFECHLQAEGYQVKVVTDANKVVAAARQWQPDLITLDLLMDVDGLTILRQLKTEPATASIPVIIISVVPELEKGLALGAVAYLTKPLQQGELLDCVRSVLDHPDGHPFGNILVVDDEKDITGWLKHALSHCGYQVTEAGDGLEALDAVAANPPDLILLDLMMPRMDGRTTIRRLRQREESRLIPIVVLSANSIDDEAERLEFSNLGVRKFMQKPASIEELVKEIQSHLPR